MSSSDWSGHLIVRLNRWAWLELFKFGRESTHWRHSNAVPLVSEIPDFVRPDTWDYADDQIPNWYMEWEKRACKKYLPTKRALRHFKVTWNNVNEVVALRGNASTLQHLPLVQLERLPPPNVSVSCILQAEMDNILQNEMASSNLLHRAPKASLSLAMVLSYTAF